MSTVQVLDNASQWTVEEYGWLQGSMAVINDALYVISHGLIIKQVKKMRKVVRSASEFRRRIGFAMIDWFRSPLKMLAKLKNAYMNFILRSMNTDNIFGEKRIPKDDPVVSKGYTGDALEAKLIFEISNLMNYIPCNCFFFDPSLLDFSNFPSQISHVIPQKMFKYHPEIVFYFLRKTTMQNGKDQSSSMSKAKRETDTRRIHPMRFGKEAKVPLAQVAELIVGPPFEGSHIDLSLFKSFKDHVAGHIWLGLPRDELRLISHGGKILLLPLHLQVTEIV
ncbi:F-box/kelch-repeat protein SKIP30 [Spatholobus suberectus]|nr:F-box/kelch-repeat protein SKIP30 [Spatholobus suberectus]